MVGNKKKKQKNFLLCKQLNANQKLIKTCWSLSLAIYECSFINKWSGSKATWIQYSGGRKINLKPLSTALNLKDGLYIQRAQIRPHKLLQSKAQCVALSALKAGVWAFFQAEERCGQTYNIFKAHIYATAYLQWAQHETSYNLCSTCQAPYPTPVRSYFVQKQSQLIKDLGLMLVLLNSDS